MSNRQLTDMLTLVIAVVMIAMVFAASPKKELAIEIPTVESLQTDAPRAFRTESQIAGPTEKNIYRGPMLIMTGDVDSPVKMWDAGGKPVFSPYYAFTKKGLGLIDKEYGLCLEGGCFFTSGAEEPLSSNLNQADGELSISAYIHPVVASPGVAGQIIGYGPTKGRPLFALVQEKDGLHFTIKAEDDQQVKWSEKIAAEPFHIVLTVSKKEIIFYKNGVKSESHKGFSGDFTQWAQGILSLGNDDSGTRPWKGRLERVSVYNKALSPEEVKEIAGALLEEIRKREQTPSIELKGTLLTQSNYPKPWDEGFTYRDVLAVSEYKVNTVVKGVYKEENIRVAEWQYVDRIFLTNSQKKIGTEYRLVVERLDVNPQLSTIQRGDTLAEDLDATIFYDLTHIEPLPENQQPKHHDSAPKKK